MHGVPLLLLLQTVAIKQLDKHGFQDNKAFLTGVAKLSQLHHENLVDIIGYCADGDQRLLVYESVPAGTLEDHLFGTYVRARRYLATGKLLQNLSVSSSMSLLNKLPARARSAGGQEADGLVHEDEGGARRRAGAGVPARDSEPAGGVRGIQGLPHTSRREAHAQALRLRARAARPGRGQHAGGGVAHDGLLRLLRAGVRSHRAGHHEVRRVQLRGGAGAAHLREEGRRYQQAGGRAERCHLGKYYKLRVFAASSTLLLLMSCIILAWHGMACICTTHFQAMPMFKDQKRYHELVDPLIKKEYPAKALNQVVAMAAMCLQEEDSVRPLMADVVMTLGFLTAMPPDPPAPAAPPPAAAPEPKEDKESDHSDSSSSSSSDDDEDNEEEETEEQ
jgi:hypothetical protein